MEGDDLDKGYKSGCVREKHTFHAWAVDCELECEYTRLWH